MSGIKRSRNALACLPCRNAKVRCDGTSSPTPSATTSPESCTRCVGLAIACVWMPSQRNGRPKKARSVTTSDLPAEAAFAQSPVPACASGEADTSLTAHTDGEFEDYLWTDWFHNVRPESLSASPFEQSTGALQLPRIPGNTPSQGDQSSGLPLPLPDPTGSRGMQITPCNLGCAPENSTHLSITASTTPSEAASLYSDDWLSLRHRIQGNSPSSSTTQSEVSSRPLYQADRCDEAGLLHFFDTFALSIPVLGDRTTFLATVEPLQISHAVGAATCIGYCTLDGARGDSSREKISDMCATLSAVPAVTQRSEAIALATLDLLLAHLLMALVLYATDDLKGASLQLGKSIDLAGRYGLGDMDPQRQASSTLLFPLLTSDARELGRAAWWELRVTDVMMSATTSGQIPRRLANCQRSRQEPRFPAPQPKASCSDAVYSLRIQAALLMDDCVKDVDSPHSSATTIDRVIILDGTLVNLIARAQSAWLKSVRMLPYHKASYLATQAICLFDTAVLLNA
ncbi:hypothetical protein BCV69DRAFT_285008 [Microstroma glucosiphilum]|uniref:Zn(2)-C6 fungal-type domain-containing protein n=1 Tax=Pseudomicrostroma glucosiphilum TaxID=1684307 RepID=A0A316U1R3_9BASI|nr:hypothetical protein BCV69DRAFT_285008 [Pseudomicrostroma glucosiphilum]PWN18383.1 hypothetical protein BCV69DRAFT_285008 [Pseudomicrostroma glucosiphilum]